MAAISFFVTGFLHLLLPDSILIFTFLLAFSPRAQPLLPPGLGLGQTD